MIHYHGTPITPRAKLIELAGRFFCVRYGEHRDVDVAHEIGQGVMLDNGAYSFWRQGKPTDWPGFVAWAEPWLDHRTTWAVMPDVIAGTEEENVRLGAWLSNYNRDVWRRCAPVWHMHESIGHLKYLCLAHERVCIGSSGQYADPKSDTWRRRMGEAMDTVCRAGRVPTDLHMLRAMDQAAGGPYPFASADSTTIARNHAGNKTRGTPPKSPRRMADEIDGRQSAGRWRPRAGQQLSLS